MHFETVKDHYKYVMIHNGWVVKWIDVYFTQQMALVHVCQLWRSAVISRIASPTVTLAQNS